MSFVAVICRTAAVSGVASLLLFGGMAPLRAQNNPEDIFRDEVIDAVARLHWKGPELSDDTRFAVAASGLSWEPNSGGVALLQHERKNQVAYTDASSRARGFHSALVRSDGQARETAFAFALSIALDPPAGEMATWQQAVGYLNAYGTATDRALLGILQAPDRLPLLPSYEYAAADLLVSRANVRMLSLFTTMADSGDTYLRSRAVLALGVIAYSTPEGVGPASGHLRANLKSISLSAVQQSMLDEIFRRAATDGRYRIRAAAAAAIGLRASQSDRKLLDKLAKDPAYLASQTGGRDTKTISFPVREEAARALARFGVRVDVGGGTFSGKALRNATRGGNDATKDQGGLKKDRSSRVPLHDGEW